MNSSLTVDWTEYDHDYEKRMQDIRTKNGKEYFECWPNAGKWMVLSLNNQPQIQDKDVTHTRLNISDY